MSQWAVELSANGKQLAFTPPFDLHITSAVLPATATDNGRTVVHFTVEEKTFALASLKLNLLETAPIDLFFSAGQEVQFHATGKNPVHLVGYFMPDNDDDDLDEDDYGELDPSLLDDEDDEEGLEGLGGDDDDEGEDDEDDDDLDEAALTQATLAKLQQLQGGQKRKADQQGGQQANGQQQQAKKVKPAEEAPKQQQQQQGGQKPKPQQQQQGGQQQKGQQQQQGGQQKPQTPAQGQQQQGGQKAPTPKPQQQGQAQGSAQKEEPREGGRQRLKSGLIIETLKIGLGASAEPGKKVSVHYVGSLKDGTVFDQSSKKSPFSFFLGTGQVIAGWDQGIKGMRVGEKRRLTIPAALGYGSRGSPPVIPGNATLMFDVELLATK